MNPSRTSNRSLARRVKVLAAIAGGVVFAMFWGAAGCGVDNAIVGGFCLPGYSPCGDHCCIGEDSSHPDVSTDSSADGRVDSRTDGPENDGTDGPISDSPTQDVPLQDGPPLDGPPGDGSGDSCVPPFDTVEHCGSCAVSCGSTDICASDGGVFSCIPLCSPPLTDCSGVCVNETNDPDNCGTCGKVCPSGFCAMSLCQGTTSGDIIVIGHDYHSAASTVTEAKILSNAAFLPTSNPMRVLSFEHYADPTSVANVKAILNSAATALGRKPPTFTVSTTDTDIPTELTIAKFDELIVYDQESAAPGVLGPLGTSWAATLATFTVAGGVVISLDGAAGTTQQMPAFDTNAGLLAVSSHTVIPKNTALDVIAPGDVVGHGVVTPYAAELDSVYFATSEANGGDVVYVVVDPVDGGQAPVVVHVTVP